MILGVSLANVTARENWSQDQSSKEQRVHEDLVRQQALSALEAILTEAKSYDDQSLRVRVGARVADVLWASNPARARELIVTSFREARDLNTDLPARYALHREIIAVARRHSPDLAAELIGELDDERDESRERLSRDSLERITERGAHYLESARELLDAGDQNRALALARRSFGEGRSSDFIWFLTNLRQKDRAAADRLFLDGLVALQAGGADPNDVLFFGLYLFYPGRVAAGNLSDGVEAVSYGVDFSAAPTVPLALARPYLQAAASALLQFQVTPGLPGAAGSVALKRFALLQLLPLFQRYEPQLLGEIGSQVAALGPYVQPNAAKETAPEIAGSATSEIITNIEKLSSAKERNHYFFTATKHAIDIGDFERATALTARIDDLNLKEATLELLSFNQARVALKRGELDEASRIAAAKLSLERSAIIYSQLADAWLEKNNYVRADEEVNHAVAALAKTEDRAQRARVYIYLAEGWAKRDKLRAFELLGAAIKEINAAERFDPSDDRITFKIVTPLATQTIVLSQGVSLLSNVSQLAGADFLRTLSLVRELRSPSPRALSVIAACRVVLDEKKPRSRAATTVGLVKSKPGFDLKFELLT
jgi:tetratricopeptide (TPR) repeat protein